MSEEIVLTPEQTKLAEEIREEWIQRVLYQYADIPQEEAQRQIDWLYEQQSLPKVRTMVVQSPHAMQKMAQYLSFFDDPNWMGTAAKKSTPADGHPKDMELAYTAWEVVADLHRESKNFIPITAKSRKAKTADHFIRVAVDELETQIRAQKVKIIPSNYIGLGVDSPWTALADLFYRTDLLPSIKEDFPRWREFMLSGIWDCTLMDRAAIVCTRPKEVHMDPQSRLHNLEGPALRWADDVKHFYIAGVSMPAGYFLNPEKELTVKAILDQSNVEVRKGMIQLFGLERFLAATNAVKLDEDTDEQGMLRRLFRFEAGTDSDGETTVQLHWCVVEVECPSKHDKHYLWVHPDMTRCSQAVAWTFGIEVPDYAPAIAT